MSIVDRSSGGLRENWITLSTGSPDYCKLLTTNILLAECWRQFGKSYLLEQTLSEIQVTKNPSSLVSAYKFIYFSTRSSNGIVQIETNIKSVYKYGYRNATCNFSVNAAHLPSVCFAFFFCAFLSASCWI